VSSNIDSSSAIGDFTGKRVTILGLGVFTGGVGAARYFASRGACVTVTDMASAEKLGRSLDALSDLPMRFVLGEHREEDILEADLIVVSPAVKDESPYLRLAVEHGVPLTTEINLVFERCRAPIIGVTGSNGKTTTTSLIGALIRAADPRAPVGGNIGLSILNEIEQTPPDTTVVLELSSFQLHRLSWIRRSPHIAVVTNLSPNHLDWHQTFEAYEEAKRQIVRFQSAEDAAVLNADDPRLGAWEQTVPARVFHFSVEKEVDRGCCFKNGHLVFRDGTRETAVGPVEAIRIPGKHNRANVAAATAAACVHGVSADLIPETVAAFQGVAHRLEQVGEINGVRYYNDSSSTTPESTIIALNAFDAPIILIAGGYDKKTPFDGLADEMARRTKAVALIGATASKIEAALEARRVGHAPVVTRASSMDEAVRRAAELSSPGDVVVLSPACASYDMFVNFEDRGARFKAAVEQYGRR
jgi:UDP-N-acetylmuramoylalanine--D-glutamate ligase